MVILDTYLFYVNSGVNRVQSPFPGLSLARNCVVILQQATTKFVDAIIGSLISQHTRPKVGYHRATHVSHG